MADPKVDFAELALDGGVDLDTVPQRVAPPRHLALEDANHDQPGNLRSRRSYAALTKSTRAGSQTANLSTLRSLITDGDALLALGDGAYTGAAWLYDSAAPEWQLADYAGQFPVTRAKSLFDQTQVERLEMARVTGFYCVYASTLETDVAAKHRFVICRESDDVVVRAGYFSITVSGSGADECQPKLVAAGSKFWLFWVDGTNVKYSSYDPASNQTDWAAATTAFGSVHATAKNLDVFAASSDRIFAIYVHTTGVAVARWHVTAGALTLDVNSTALFAGKFPNVIGIAAPNSSYVAISFQDAATMVAHCLNESTLALLNSYTLEVAIAGTPCEVCLLAYDATGTEYSYAACTVAYTVQESGAVGMPTANTRFWRINLANTAKVQGQTASGCYLTRKPKRIRSSDVWAMGHQPLLDAASEWLFVDFRWQRGATPPATPRVGGGAGQAIIAQLNPLGSMPPNKNKRVMAGSIIQMDTLGEQWALPAYERLSRGDGGPIGLTQGHLGSRVRLERADFRGHVAAPHFVYGDQLFVGGSYPRRWARDCMREGFVDEVRGLQAIVPPCPPRSPVLSQGAGGALTALGIYSYVVTEEYAGPDGRRSQSAPSLPTSITLAGGNNQVTVNLDGSSAPFTEPSMTRGVADHYLWVVWRTKANATDLIYYRCGTVTAGTASFVDQTSDANIALNEVLYTVGGELENQAPPPSLAMFPWKDRIVCLHGETGELWPSKSWDASEVGGWNIELAVQTNVWRGAPVFASPLDDKIVVWWADAIGVSYGEPPSDTGEGGTLAPPLIVKKGVGLRDVASVVETTDALLFRGQRGFYALGRDLSVAFIGRLAIGLDVGDCLGALYLTEREEVRWLFSNQLIVYHLTKQEWCVHLLGQTTGEVPTRPTIVDGVVVGDDGVLCWGTEPFTNAGYAWIEDEDASADPDDTRPLLRASTGWIQPQGVLGPQHFTRVWLTGEISSDATLAIYYDYASTPAQTKLFSAASTPADGTLATYEVHLPREDCTALRFEFIGKNASLLSLRLGSIADKGAYQRNARRL